MKLRNLKRHFIITGGSLAVATGIFLMIISNAVFNGENFGHFAEHFIIAVLILLLAFVRFRRSPNPTPTGRVARLTLGTGLVLFGVGTLIEAIGAFGYLGTFHANKVLVTLHDGSYFLAWPGFFITLLGVALELISLFQRRNSRII